MSDKTFEESDPFEQAVSLHQAGRFVEAIEIYRRILESEGEDPVVLELLGSALAAIDDREEALRSLDRSIAIDPGSPTAWLHRGTVKESLGDAAGALVDLRTAISLDPDSPEIAARLGTALLAHGSIDEAWETLTRAIEANPSHLGLRSLRADAASRSGRFSEAESELLLLLGQLPQDPVGLALLARLRSLQGRPLEALRAARQAHQSDPNRPETRLNLATALASTGDPSDSREALALMTESGSPELAMRDRERISAMAEIVLGSPERAARRMRRWTAVEADDAEAWGVLASALRLGEDSDAALVAARRANRLAPDVVGFIVELGRILLERGDADAAIVEFEKAVQLGGRTPATGLELITALKLRGLVGRAIRVADEVCRTGEADSEFGMARVMLLHDAGRHREAVEQGEKFVEDDRLAAKQVSNHLFGLQYSDQIDEPSLTRSHARLAVRVSPAPAGAWRVDRDEDRALRVGFVSADLKAHAVAWFLRPLLRHLDRGRLEAYAYSNTRSSDPVSDWLRRETVGWRRIVGRVDDEVAEEILEDRIDVLIDLGGHTADNRLGVFRHTPAPVQITWLGYPNTTGIPEIGWRLVDALTDPLGTEAFATEALLRMEAPFLCFDVDVTAIDIPERPERPVHFGSFNNTAKLSDRCLGLWARVIEAVPGSRLLLKSRAFEDPEFRAPTLERLEQVGIDRARVDLLGFSRGVGAHHLAYAQIDVALDTFPYHGTTTTCEALWNGVPVVSRIGEVHRARVGKTLLHAVGLPELACDDDESFVQAAVGLASDAARRRSLHAGLRDRMRRSPLCDGSGFARRFETAIRHAWRCWCRGEAPKGVFLSEGG